MTKLPQVKPKKILKLLLKLGLAIKHKRGSHVFLVHPDGRRTQVSIHNKPLAKGTLRAIIRQAKLDKKQLKKLL